MTTLREAAQQALESLRLYKVCYGTSPAEEATLTALRAALAELEQGPVQEPVQEPVAWLRLRDGKLARNDGGNFGNDWMPLYTAPPQRKPLTEEEIQDCFYAARNAKLGSVVVEIARAIERAHGIGGQDEP